MADFIKAFKRTVSKEGGYSNNPNDKGGETYKGVTRKNYPNLELWKYIDYYKTKYGNTYGLNKQLENIEEYQQEIQNVYKKNYWDKLLLDEVISQKIANELFDDAINRGTNAVITLIKRLYKCTSKTTKIKDLVVLINKKIL